MTLTEFILVSVLIAAVEGIRISSLHVPSVALKGDEIRLRCDYAMDGGSSLYSLKWYKDGQEFYRHVPGNGQSGTQKCPLSSSSPSLPGISVNCQGSSEREVVLANASTETSGEYRCEVIGDHPAFRREEQKATIKVYSEPLEKPVIQGAASEYDLGSEVRLNCSSRNREYVPNLAWLLNGQPAQQHEVLYIHLSNQRTLGLLFSADQTRFIQGKVRVTCRANLGSLHVQSASKTLAIPGLLRPQYYSHGSSLLAASGLPAASLLLVVLA